ncbi:ABC transporter permease [Desulfurobacterium atlanticum]|uniref:Iron(III) transport system permease protein n=1 Tax=Desulfurobacterium atlanticum TaxID=240169 RepID=A0A238Z9D2_9BACT|nr:iron ABC transporter permease [Desulfurobacterium atlanticum]SNR79669.1 iron(III) transport system permease protein [Desulfurobacterium atlanticum]
MSERSLRERFSLPLSEIQILWVFTLFVLIITTFYPFALLVFKSITGVRSEEVLKAVLTDRETYVYTFNTIKLAVFVTVLAIILGVPSAFLVSRTDIYSRKILKFLIVLSFTLPPYVSAIAWIQLAAPYSGYLNRFFHLFGFPADFINIYSFWGIVLVMAIKYYIYVFLTTSASLEQIDPSLEEAARMSGASPFKASLLTLKLVIPSIASGALLVFIATCANFGIPALIGERANFYVLTTKIYSALSIPDLDRAVILSLFLIVITAVVLLIQKKVSHGKHYTTVTGKASRPSLLKLGKVKIAVSLLLYIVLFITTVVPISSLFFSALLKTPVAPLTSVDSYTLSNFLFVIFKDPSTTEAIKTSFFSSALAASVITVFGALIAYIVVKTDIKGRTIIDFLSSIPYILPGTVVGVAIIVAFIKFPFFETLWILPFAYFIRYLSYGVRTVTGSLLQIDKTLEEASFMSGASWVQTFKNIIYPLLKSGLLAAWILVFIPALSELTVSIIIYPPQHPTIGVATYNLMEEGSYSFAYALSALVTLIVVVSYGIVTRITGKFAGRRI